MPADTAERSRAQQIAIAASAVVALVGGTLGSGAFVGTPVAEAAGGALSADATLVAPAGPAFAIWSLIYAGLVALAVWQLLPQQRTNQRLGRAGWLAALSMLLNAAWIAVVQLDLLLLSAVVIVALLVTLAATLARLVATRPASTAEAVVLDGTTGLYLGWVSIATVANVAAYLAQVSDGQLVLGDDAWAVVVLLAAGAIGAWLAVAGRGRLSVAVALAWGLGWITVGRLAGDPGSTPAAVTAAFAALVTLGAAVVVRLRSRGSAA